MKTIFSQYKRAVAFASAALLLGGLGNICKAGAFDSPVGSWDLVCSGAGQNGIAVLTFSNNFTFSGYQLNAPNPPKKSSNANPRGSVDTGRGATSASSGSTNNFVFGFNRISGPWNYDSKGRVVGFFVQVLNVSAVATNYHATNLLVTITNGINTTNVVLEFTDGQASASTNITWTIPPSLTYIFLNPNFTVDVTSAERTNSVSFTGSVAPGKRLSLIGSTSFGKTTYRGVPYQNLLNLSGSWVGTKKQSGQVFYEFFSLGSSAANNPFLSDFPDAAAYPNIYFSTNGVGPGYSMNGVALLSNQKKIGFTFVQDGTLRATLGPINTKRIVSAKTKGVIEPLTGISFDAFLQIAP